MYTEINNLNIIEFGATSVKLLKLDFLFSRQRNGCTRIILFTHFHFGAYMCSLTFTFPVLTFKTRHCNWKKVNVFIWQCIFLSYIIVCDFWSMEGRWWPNCMAHYYKRNSRFIFLILKLDISDKTKVKLSLSTPWRYRGSGHTAPLILNRALIGGQWPALRRPFDPSWKSPAPTK